MAQPNGCTESDILCNLRHIYYVTCVTLLLSKRFRGR